MDTNIVHPNIFGYVHYSPGLDERYAVSLGDLVTITYEKLDDAEEFCIDLRVPDWFHTSVPEVAHWLTQSTRSALIAVGADECARSVRIVVHLDNRQDYSGRHRREPASYESLDTAVCTAVLAAHGRLRSDITGNVVCVGRLHHGSARSTPGTVRAVKMARAAIIHPISPIHYDNWATTIIVPATDSGVLRFLESRHNDVRDRVRAINHVGQLLSANVPFTPLESPSEPEPRYLDIDDVPHPVLDACVAAVTSESSVLLVSAKPVALAPLTRAAVSVDTLDPYERAAVAEFYSDDGLAYAVNGCSPLRAPHHSISLGSLQQEARLARHGLLVLEDVVEFRTECLKWLCSVIANGVSCGVIATARPCPCSRPVHDQCMCSTTTLSRYRERLDAFFNVVEHVVDVDGLVDEPDEPDKRYWMPDTLQRFLRGSCEIYGNTHEGRMPPAQLVRELLAIGREGGISTALAAMKSAVADSY